MLPAMDASPTLRIALHGAGTPSERWRAALRALPSVAPVPAEDGAEAIVLAPGTADPFTQAKEALLAGTPVLFAAPFLLSPHQTASLEELASRQRCLLRFFEPFRHRPGFTFLSRLLAGDDPFWRPLYVRSLRLVPPGSSTRIDGLAAEELAMCDLLLDGAAQQVSATASRTVGGEVQAVFLTLHYEGGLVVQCTVSLAEATAAHQLVAVTKGRSIVLDELDAVAPLRIFDEGAAEVPVGNGHRLVRSWQPTPGSAALKAQDPVVAEAQSFVVAVLQGEDGTASNVDRWVRVAALWWAARRAMSWGQPVAVPREAVPVERSARPALRLIRGGGQSKTAPMPSERPALTLLTG